jgi:hypothetical protein
MLSDLECCTSDLQIDVVCIVLEVEVVRSKMDVVRPRNGCCHSQDIVRPKNGHCQT